MKLRIAMLVVLALGTVGSLQAQNVEDPGGRIESARPPSPWERLPNAAPSPLALLRPSGTSREDAAHLPPGTLVQDIAADTAPLNLSPAVRDGALWGVFLGTGSGLIGGALAARHVSLDTGVAVGVFGASGALMGGLIGAAAGALVEQLR